MPDIRNHAIDYEAIYLKKPFNIGNYWLVHV